MPAMTMTSTEYLGASESELTAAGALCTAREIEQQPRMLQRTHALVAGLGTDQSQRADTRAGA